MAPNLLRAGAEGDAKSEAPQASRSVALPLGSVDAISGTLSFRMPMGPKLPGRIPVGFHWYFNSQDGGQGLIGGGIRPVVWPGGSWSPLQTTVLVEGEPWVFNSQAHPTTAYSAAQFIQWAQDRGVLSKNLETPPNVTAIVPSSDGTKFYVIFTTTITSASTTMAASPASSAPTSSLSTTSASTSSAPMSGGSVSPNMGTITTVFITRAVLYEDSAIWTMGPQDAPSPDGRTTHFTNRWGDHVTVVEDPQTGTFGAPTKITITDVNRPTHTITLSAALGTVAQVGAESRFYANATLTISNTLKGADGVYLPKITAVGTLEWQERVKPGYSRLDPAGRTGIFDQGLFPSSITATTQGATVENAVTSFAWPFNSTDPRLQAPLNSVTLPSGTVETFTTEEQANPEFRRHCFDPTSGYWQGIQPSPNGLVYDDNSNTNVITWVKMRGAGTGRSIQFVRQMAGIPCCSPYTVTPAVDTTLVLHYGAENPTSSDKYRGLRLTHLSSYSGMVGDTSLKAYLFVTRAILTMETLHGTGLCDPNPSPTQPALSSALVDQRTVYDGWTLRSWGNPNGTLSTTVGLPLTAVALRTRTWALADEQSKGQLPDHTTIAGNPAVAGSSDAWGPILTDEYWDAPSTAPAVDPTSIGLAREALTVPSAATHRRGVISRSWDMPLMRLLTQTDHKTLDGSAPLPRYAAPNGTGAAPPNPGLTSVDFGTTTYDYSSDPEHLGRIASQTGVRGGYTASEARTYVTGLPLIKDTTKSLTDPTAKAVYANGVDATVTAGKTYTYTDTQVQSGPSTVVDKADGRTESFLYDDLGRVTSHTDVLGIVTTTAYDGWGRIGSITRQASGGVAALTTSYAHDPNGLWKTETTLEGDSNRSLTTRTDFDAFGRVVKVTGPDGSVQTFQYDGFDQKTAQSPALKPGQTAWGNETWAYDDRGRMTDHWDSQARLLQHVNLQPTWQTMSGLAAVWTTSADDRGFSRSDAHDLLGQKAAVLDQGGQLSQYFYDQDGHLLQTLQGTQQRSYTYNAMGWMTSRTEPEEGQTLYSAFTLEGVPTVTTQKGRSGARTNTFTTKLDAHLQPAWITATGPEGTVTRTFTYDYGTTNTHLLTALSETQANGTLTESYPMNPPAPGVSAYDGLYRLVSKTISDGTQSFTVSRTLDAAGRTLTLSYPTGGGRVDQVALGYDSLGRSTTVALNGETRPSGSMVYDQIATTAVANTLTFGNNAWTKSTVDKGELTHVTHVAAAGTLEDDAVTWTAGGLMLSRGTDSYTYDALQRLATSHVKHPTLTSNFVDQSFVYDRYGNRTSSTTTAPAGTLASDSEALNWTAAYTSGNDLPASVTATSGSLSTGRAYDDLGRLTQVWTTPGLASTQTSWVYDPSGRVMSENGTLYLLDSAGLRFKRWKMGGTLTYTVYGFGREPLSVFTKAPTTALAWQKTCVYGFGQELREDQAGAPLSTIYIQSDQVGSPNLITNTSGALINRAKNLPFGERLLDANPNVSKSIRRFTNHEEDPDSNAIYMQAREYLAAYGKFAQVDPAYDQTKDDPESWNLYNYTTNNPVTHTDPDGRTWLEQPDAHWTRGGGDGGGFYWDYSNVEPTIYCTIEVVGTSTPSDPQSTPGNQSGSNSGGQTSKEGAGPSTKTGTAQTGDGAWYRAVAGKDSVTIWKMEYVEGGGLCLPQDIFGGSYAATDMTVLKANAQGNMSMYDMAGLPGAQFQISTVNMPKSESFTSTKDAANFFNLASDYHQQFSGDKLQVNSANRNDGALFGSHTNSHNADRPAIDVAYQNNHGSNLSGHSASKLADVDRAKGLLSLAKQYGFGRTVTYIEGIGSYQIRKNHDNHIHLGEGDVQ